MVDELRRSPESHVCVHSQGHTAVSAVHAVPEYLQPTSLPPSPQVMTEPTAPKTLRDLGAVSKSRAVRGGGGGGLYTKFYAAYFPASYGDEAADVARERQEKIDADDMVHLHTYLLDYEIPHVYLSFDRLTIDEGYAYRALAPLLRGYDVSRADFRRAYDAAAALYRGDGAIVEVT